MEDTISLILRGCTLARELEMNVSNLGNHQPDLISFSKSCDDILSIFSAAKERLSNRIRSRESQSMSMSMERDVGLDEWLRSACTQAMEIAQMRIRSAAAMDIPGRFPSQWQEPITGGLGLASASVPVPVPVASDDFGSKQMAMASSSSSQKTRRRKDDMEKRSVRVPAPRIGNTELPPDDGFTWRKYGQKEILGSRFPRSYFRCTHQKLYHCFAKKHVQRLDDDPFTFEVTYRGNHICHMSSTAPSVPPPPPQKDIVGQHLSPNITTTQFPTSSTALARWLSMEFSGSGSGSGVSSGSTGPSTVRYGKEVDQFPVLDMADAMFNSGSCSTNSMDSIFQACMGEEQRQRWEKEDKKD